MKLRATLSKGTYEIWSDKRPCHGCGRVRNVAVTRRRVKEAEPFKEEWARFCRACEKIQRAVYLHKQARRFLADALEELTKHEIPMDVRLSVLNQFDATDLLLMPKFSHPRSNR